MSLLGILLVILVLALIFGGVGYNRYGYAAGSPLLIIIVIILLLWAFGSLR